MTTTFQDYSVDLTVDTKRLNDQESTDDYNPLIKAFLAGSFSGTFSTILFQPLDLVKTRLQNPSSHVYKTAKNGASVLQPGMMTTFASIIRQEHVIGLWRGMVPSIARCVPGVGLYFSSLHWLKGQYGARQGKELGPLEAMMLGVLARSMSGTILIPITVIKTRFESGVYKYSSISGALQAIWRAEGLRGLMCGLGPTLARDAPFSGLYLMFYTQAKQALPKEWLEHQYGSALHFACGVCAGSAASLVTNPADVLKTNMQLYPHKFPNVLHATIFVYQTYGVTGYFKGAVPRMIRRTLMAAMAWTIYEQITRSIGLK